MNLYEIKHGLLNLKDIEFIHFWDWFDNLCDEKWAEEVENDPMAKKCLEIANIIMSKPDPGKFFADLLGRNASKTKE